MDAAPHNQYPNIVPCLVFPFERFRVKDGLRDPALIFGQRGDFVLFAAEATREYGVGVLGSDGSVAQWSQHKTLHLAALDFLARDAVTQ